MTRDSKPSTGPTRSKAIVEMSTHGTVVLATVTGLIDEHFTGFGAFPATVGSLVINASGITRMTSFGVRQWLKGMDALPKTLTSFYMLGCPTFFVDQLNMVLNFGGGAQILTVVAPYTCPSCGQDSGEIIDVLAERAALAKGGVPEKHCGRCGAKLEFDETPESYFAFVGKYAASTIEPATAQALAERDLYIAAVDTSSEKPPRIIKLVRGHVTYFRISGNIGATFRARPFLVGAEGEVVLDLAEVEQFDASGQHEWRRLLKSLSAQVEAITLVDLNDSFLATAGDSFTMARNVTVWSVLLPYVCIDCGHDSRESLPLKDMDWPPVFAEHVCSRCGGTTRNELPLGLLATLQRFATSAPQASAKLIEQRDEVLSRELTDANVAQAGESATASLATDDTILGKYKIVRRLSAGGMAEVFLAKQVGIGGFEKPVALKRIQRQLLESRHLAIDMFLNEAKIAGRLMHPNIVEVLDVGEVGGALYLAMEYVRGKDLRDVVKQLRATNSTMPLGEVCFVMREVAQALHHAYWSTDLTGSQLAVVHRDVSPHNIVLSYEGAVKLLDFGVAVSAVTEQAESMIVGKWQYMSPEHTTSQTLDHRSDLFSLGVILYLLCAGVLPFTDSNHREIVRKIRSSKYKPLHLAAPNVPEDLSVLVARLLAANPDERPQTGQEVAAVLTEIARTHNFERGQSDLARFLESIFPADLADSSATPARGSGQIALPRTGSSSSLSPVRVSSRQIAVARSPGSVEQVARTKRDSKTIIMGAKPASPTGARTSSPNVPKVTTRYWTVVLFMALLGAFAVAYVLTR